MIKENKKLIIIIMLSLTIVITAFTMINSPQTAMVIELISDGNINEVVTYIQSFGILAPLLSILLMVLQAFVAPIPAFLIAGANGILFGIIGGVFISWIGAMLGAIGTFYLSRILGADFVNKMVKSNELLENVNKMSSKHGFKVILVSRLIPFVSFDLISYAAGLSKISTRDFILATGIGMIPGTVTYVLLANRLVKPSVFSLPVTGILLLLILLYLIYKYMQKKNK